MIDTNIKYPFAFDNLNKKLVQIKDINDSNKDKLICKECEGPFIPVINHITPHFKHKPNSNCSASKESYIHWVTKELFKTIKKINIPALYIDDLSEKKREKFQLIYNKVIDNSIPQNLRFDFKKTLKRNLTDEFNFDVKSIEIEKEFKTKKGKVRIDIVLNNQNKIIFIEPFYTNEIDFHKMEKLQTMDITTYSINLNNFLNKFLVSLSHNSLENYLISSKSKKCEFLSNNEFNFYLKEYQNYLNNEINEFSPFIELFNNFNNSISKNEKEIKNLSTKIEELNIEILSLKEDNRTLLIRRDNILKDFELK